MPATTAWPPTADRRPARASHPGRGQPQRDGPRSRSKARQSLAGAGPAHRSDGTKISTTHPRLQPVTVRPGRPSWVGSTLAGRRGRTLRVRLAGTPGVATGGWLGGSRSGTGGPLGYSPVAGRRSYTGRPSAGRFRPARLLGRGIVEISFRGGAGQSAGVGLEPRRRLLAPHFVRASAFGGPGRGCWRVRTSGVAWFRCSVVAARQAGQRGRPGGPSELHGSSPPAGTAAAFTSEI